MIEFQNISVHFGTHNVLSDVNLRINKGERVGITGPNGSGKSTLFRLILGDVLPDAGKVVIEESPLIGSVRQHLKPDSPEETLLEYVLCGVPGLAELEHEIHALEASLVKLTDQDERERLLRRIGILQSEFEHLGGYEIESRAKIALGGLGFREEDFERYFVSFSGGWQMRAELARVLAVKPDLLLLDEPSNYLDLPAVEWLQRFLRSFEGTLILISHDRYLLRTLTTITVEVDAQTTTRYQGDLDFYLREREVRHNNLIAARANQDRRIEQLSRFVERFKSTASKASQAQSRIKMIEKIQAEAVVVPKHGRSAGVLRLASAPHAGAEIVRFEEVDFSYDGKHNVVKGASLSIARGDKVALTGYNGMGKTTLLRLMAGTIQPTNGRVVAGYKVVTGYLSQEFSETMTPDISVIESARRCADGMAEKDLRTQLGAFGFSADDIGKPVDVLSGGEKIRLAFLRLFLLKPNFLLLDEPTTHLDLEGRTALEAAVRSYDGTLCLVSHDVEFVRSTVNTIIEVSPRGIQRFAGGYEYYREKVASEQTVTDFADTQTVNAGAIVSGTSAREQRQTRARERAKLQPRIKYLSSKVARTEKNIDELEKELEELSAVLFNPTPETDFATLNKRLKVVQDQLDDLGAKWESAASELESLRQQSREYAAQ